MTHRLVASTTVLALALAAAGVAFGAPAASSQSLPATMQAASQPATASAPAGAVTIKSIKKADDGVQIGSEGGRCVVTIISKSGIGSAVLAADKGLWPEKILLRFRYADGRAFERLEGFEAWLQDAAGAGKRAVDHTAVKNGQPVTTELKLPADGRLSELHVTWIDAYR